MTERLVIYDSYFGNTEQVAKVIGESLGALVRKVDALQADDLKDLKILIVGSPTRAFNPTTAIKDFLKAQKGKLADVKGGIFDTRIPIDKTDSGFLKLMIRLFGYADTKMAKAFKKTGASLALEPTGFGVLDSEGPLVEGELERAANWAKSLL